jgi:hypothetical protein
MLLICLTVVLLLVSNMQAAICLAYYSRSLPPLSRNVMTHLKVKGVCVCGKWAVFRIRIRIGLASWIRVRIRSEDPGGVKSAKTDPDPHSSKSLDPDPHLMNADPKPWKWVRPKLHF